MACNQTKEKATLHHDRLALMLSRTICRAGCASSVEPAHSILAAHHSGNPGLQGGDILAVIPSGHVAVLDCVVTHPAAPSYLPGASQTVGFPAAWMEQVKRSDL